MKHTDEWMDRLCAVQSDRDIMIVCVCVSLLIVVGSKKISNSVIRCTHNIMGHQHQHSCCHLSPPFNYTHSSIESLSMAFLRKTTTQQANEIDF